MVVQLSSHLSYPSTQRTTPTCVTPCAIVTAWGISIDDDLIHVALPSKFISLAAGCGSSATAAATRHHLHALPGEASAQCAVQGEQSIHAFRWRGSRCPVPAEWRATAWIWASDSIAAAPARAACSSRGASCSSDTTFDNPLSRAYRWISRDSSPRYRHRRPDGTVLAPRSQHLF